MQPSSNFHQFLRLPDESLKIATKHLSGVGVISQCIARLSERAEQFKRTNKMRTNNKRTKRTGIRFWIVCKFEQTRPHKATCYSAYQMNLPQILAEYTESFINRHMEFNSEMVREMNGAENIRYKVSEKHPGDLIEFMKD